MVADSCSDNGITELEMHELSCMVLNHTSHRVFALILAQAGFCGDFAGLEAAMDDADFLVSPSCQRKADEAQPSALLADISTPSSSTLHGAESFRKADSSSCLTEEEFLRMKRMWGHKLLIQPEQKALGTWLTGRRQSDKCLVFCCVCASHAENKKSTWATGIAPTHSFQLGHALRHGEKSKVHQAAVKKYLKALAPEDNVQPTDDEEPVFLNTSSFNAAIQKAWEGCKKGESFRGLADSDLGSKDRVGRIVQVMGSVCLEADQKMLRKSEVLALYQDVRAGALCVRYSAVSRDSQSCSRGLLGLCHNAGTKALDLLDSMASIITRFCTLPSGEVDEQLFQHICHKVEFLQADAASDEQLTMRFSEQELFMNVRVIDKDPTHAARRLLRNAWQADPYLSSVLSQYISSPEAMVSVIQYSADLKHLFEATVLQDEDAPFSIKNLGFAAHRFDSQTKPLSRFIVLFDSIWSCAIDISNRRKGTRPGERANSFLAEATEESLLQLALMADGSCETLDVIRFFDRESYDAAAVAEMLTLYKHRLDLLFVQKEVVNCPGHTSHMISLLKAKERTALLKQGQLKCLGGANSVPPEMLDRCLARMCNWVQLVHARLQAEFPNHDLINNMEVFNLGDSLDKAAQTQHHIAQTQKARKANLSRLSQAFGLATDTESQSQLFKEYCDLRRNALHVMQTGKAANNTHAWTQARGKLNDRRLKQYGTSHIDVILCRYVALCGSTTSGVEQTFATFVRNLGDFRLNMLPSLQEHLLRVVLGPETASDAFMKDCQRMWSQLFSEFRKSSCSSRWLATRERSALDGTETSWQKRRRTALDNLAGQHAVRASEDVLKDAASQGESHWQPSHEQEAKSLRNLATDARLEAFARNRLLTEEIGGSDGQAALEAALVARSAKRHKDESEHRRNFERWSVLARRPNMIEAPLVAMLIDDAAIGEDVLETMAQTMSKHNMTLCADLLASNYVVVESQQFVPTMAKLAGALTGAVICTPTYIISVGLSGSCTAMKAAISKQRRVWMSDGFLLQHQEEADLLLRAVALCESKWRIVSEEAFLQHVLNNKSGVKHIALISAEEKKDWVATTVLD